MADEYIAGLGTGDLQSFNNSVIQSDPYNLVGNSIAAWRPNTSTWSPGTTAATAFGQAFLSSLLGNYARQRAADQTNAVISVLPQLRTDPMSVAAPEGVAPDAFATLKANAFLKNQISEGAQDEAKKSRVAALLNTVLGESVRSGKTTPDEAIKIASSDDPVAALNEAATSRTPVTLSPYDKALAKYGDPELARAYVKATNPEFLAAQVDAERQKSGVDLSQKATEKQAANLQALEFSAKQFEDAKNLSSIAAMFPGTTSANEMAGIQTNLRTKLQQMLGREMNGPEQAKLMEALPDWNDSKAQIDSKKTKFLELVSSLSPPSVGATLAPTLTVPDAAPQSVPPGMKLQRNKLTGETRLVPQ